ncbi:hypothetical protein SM033_00024 [Vibrio phage vB_VpaM_sm033]|nr:hypothetical protein SM033_00024 [Vibrio phage vB_VpaM_sm033]
MKHYRQLVLQEMLDLFAARAKYFRNFIITDKVTIYLGKDHEGPEEPKEGSLVFSHDHVAGKFSILMGSNEEMARIRALQNEESMVDLGLIHTWVSDPFDLKGLEDEEFTFEVKGSRWNKNPIESYYGTPCMKVVKNIDIQLPKDKKFHLRLTDKLDPVIDHGLTVFSIIATGSSGGGHGEGHWDSGFLFDTELGYIAPNPKRHKIEITLPFAEVNFK